jgi:crotonobetainyl-CoA:carnitine CoA-transferase CaiB-like acyl-CoA transferase
MSGLLSGLRVLDLSLWQPGHTATQLLADLGADVLKIEPPGGDRMRALPDRFLNFNSHKRSVVLDLKRDEDRARLLRLVADVEVVVEGFRPGVADRLGAGYERLSAANPGLVYCSISGFGQTGPLAQVSGHDHNYQAYAGAFVRPSSGSSSPAPTAALIGDQGSGLAAAFAILAAVLCARRTGRGEKIDVSIADLLVSWVAPAGPIGDPDQRPMRTGPSAGMATYRTADGGDVVLGIFSEDHFWKLLCRHIALDVHADLTMAERAARGAELVAAVGDRFSARTRDDLVGELGALGIPIAPVLSREEALGQAHFWDRGVLARDVDGVRRVAHPVRYASHPALPPGPAPALGQGGGESPPTSPTRPDATETPVEPHAAA